MKHKHTDECLRYAAQIREILSRLQRGIYDFEDIPVEVKNFVYNTTQEAFDVISPK